MEGYHPRSELRSIPTGVPPAPPCNTAVLSPWHVGKLYKGICPWRCPHHPQSPAGLFCLRWVLQETGQKFLCIKKAKKQCNEAMSVLLSSIVLGASLKSKCCMTSTLVQDIEGHHQLMQTCCCLRQLNDSWPHTTRELS